jgi:putative ABC transport system permease protein
MTGDRWPAMRRLLRLPDSRQRLARDIDTELRFHIEERVEELVTAGMPREDAERHVRAALGDVQRYRSEMMVIDDRGRRAERRFELRDSLTRETRQAARALARQPIFTSTALATLALGLGATTAIFALLDGVVLRPLPYADSRELVRIEHPVPGFEPEARWNMALGSWQYFRRESKRLTDIGLWRGWQSNVMSNGEAERVSSALATASLFTTLRLRPLHGRVFTEDSNLPGAPPVVVLDHDYWQRRFGGDPSIVGRSIDVDGRMSEVVAVLPPRASLPHFRVDLWIPLEVDPNAKPINSHSYWGVARLAPGVTAAEAQVELATLVRRFPDDMPSAYSPSFMERFGFGVSVTSLRDDVLGDFARTVWVLLGSVGLVLLVACANVASLFAARAEARRREVAVRAALGASRLQLALRPLVESGLIAMASAVVGLVLASWSFKVLVALAPSDVPRLRDVTLDWRSGLFAFLLAVVVATAFALMPALRRGVSARALHDGARGSAGGRVRHRARRALVVTQTALALVLLAAGGLLLRSVAAYRDVKPGFDATGVLAFDVSLPTTRFYSWEDVGRYHRELQSRLRALTGVQSVGSIPWLPLSGRGGGCNSLRVENRPPRPGEPPPCFPATMVSPDYFRTMGISVQGRELDWDATVRGDGQVVVSRAFADRVWPGEDPIGRGVSGGAGDAFYRVVGVADDVRMFGLDQAAPQLVYFPLIPMPGAGLWIPARLNSYVLRTNGATPETFIPLVRRVINELDPSVALANPQSMEAMVAQSYARVSFVLLLLIIAGTMSLVLSVVGLYGVVSYIFAERRGEIGLRMALGARVGDVRRMVLGESLWLSGIGVLIGLAGAFAATRVLRGLLFGVSPADPLTLGSVALGLVAMAAAASYLPARRATKVEPASVLRSE